MEGGGEYAEMSRELMQRNGLSELVLVVQTRSRLVLERPPVSAVLLTLPVDR